MHRGSRNIIIFGAGNLASNTVNVLFSQGFEILGYISTEKPGTLVKGLPVLGDIEYYLKNPILHQNYFHIAIGENSIRYKIMQALEDSADMLHSVISEHSLIADNCVIEKGTYISHGAVIQNEGSIGTCCIIDTGVILEHHVHIGKFVNVSPGAVLCGGVTVADGAIIGASSTVIEKISIGENSLIGAGSVVISDIEPNVIAVGNPARIIKKRNFFDAYIK